MQNLFDKKLQFKSIKMEKAHRRCNKEKVSRTKRKLFKKSGKKGININVNKDFPKETLGIRNGKWKTVKNLRKKVHTLS